MEKRTTERGFEIIEFTDQKGVKCSIQESSLYLPCVWIGVNNANPQIMASQAVLFGLETTETQGWVDYPIPEEVSLNTRMHLDKPMLREFIDTLEEYYKNMPDYEED